MIIVFLQRRLKEKLPFVNINTLLLHIPPLALTDRQNYRQQNKTLAARGLEELFFQLWCVSIDVVWYPNYSNSSSYPPVVSYGTMGFWEVTSLNFAASPSAQQHIKSDPTHHHQRGGGGITAFAQAGDSITLNRPIYLVDVLVNIFFPPWELMCFRVKWWATAHRLILMAPSRMLDGFSPRNEPLHPATRAASTMASVTRLFTWATAPPLLPALPQSHHHRRACRLPFPPSSKIGKTTSKI